MSLIARIATGTTPKSGDSLVQDLTVPGFGGKPTAAIIFWGGGLSSGVFAADARIGIGLQGSPKVFNNRALALYSEDNVNPTATSREIQTSKVLVNADTAESDYADATFIKDGIRLTFTGVYAENYRIQALLIGGVSSVANTNISLGTGAGSYSDTNVPFKPNFMIAIGALTTDFEAIGNHASTIGFAVQRNDGTIDQFCHYLIDLTGTPSAVDSVIRNNAVAGYALNGTDRYNARVTQFNSNGYTVFVSSNGVNQIISTLCFKLDSPPHQLVLKLLLLKLRQLRLVYCWEQPMTLLTQ